MARKRTKGKVTKRIARKKVTKTARAGRPKGKAAKKPHEPSSKTPEAAATVESSRAIDLLRSWSPSRYSHR